MPNLRGVITTDAGTQLETRTTTATATTLAQAALGRPGTTDTIALIDRGRAVTYGELAAAVDNRVDGLDFETRTLVVLAGSRSLEFVVTYLAVLSAGHVPLLAGDHAERLAATWSAGATVSIDGDDVDMYRNPAAGTPDLHPDLALLLSTSGSLGSPKLVRLSHRNLVSNATAIAESLDLRSTDRGITSLPLHYCYGLSVLHSHLIAGAGVVLTDASVVDPCFRTAMADHGVTSVAGVPHTFDLLDQLGPEHLYVPSLRLITQAGGRLAPERVRSWIEQANSWGADFRVMYGQTEATARMAVLPPDVATHRPGAIGRAIPGGELRIRPVDGAPPDTGELVYRGPNVMMGYATSSTDLAAGPQLDELATGDLARFHVDDGVFEIVGRRARFVKPFGLRIDLDHLERELAAVLDLAEVAVTGDDGRLVVAAPHADTAAVVDHTSRITTLPANRIAVDVEQPIPRTPSDKVDYRAIADQAGRPKRPVDAALGAPVDDAADRPTGNVPGRAIAATYAAVLGRSSADIGAADTFVSLGGDSLSYIECSIRLERILGRVPPDWHLRPVSELAALAAPRRRFTRIDTTVPLRALAICLVVATHMRLWFFPGGAHLLLAVVGFNLARFMMSVDSTRERVRAGLRTAARTAIPTMAWVAAGMVAVGAYSTGTLLLVNNYVGGPSHRTDHWHFWFIEAFVHLVLVSTALLAIPAVRRVECRHPWAFPLAVLAVCVALRMPWAHLGDWYNMRFRTHTVAWLFVLGWLVQRSESTWQRLATTGLCLALIPGFFRYAPREWFIIGALVLLVWCRELPAPRQLIRPIGTLASASMWIFVTHFTFWPWFLDHMDRRLAYVATITAGVVVWAAGRHLGAATRHILADRHGDTSSLGSPHVGRSRRRTVASPPPNPIPLQGLM